MANYFYFGDLEKKYIYIKYFFVYELPYAKEIIEKLYSKGNQEFRKIWKILEENADQIADDFVEVSKDLAGTKVKRGYVPKNVYATGQELWQNYLYTLRDKGKGNETEKTFKKRMQVYTYIKNLWEKIREDGSITASGNDICLEFSWSSDADKTLTWEADEETDNIYKAYKKIRNSGILEKREKRLYVFKWEAMKDLEKFICSNEKILEMLSFFDKFMPLSVFGFLIRKRFQKSSKPISIIVRGLSPFSGFRYENIYRTIIAASEKVEIAIGDRKISKPELWVGGKSFISRNETIYIGEKNARPETGKNIGKFIEADVCFLCNNETSYIEKRTKEMWLPIDIGKPEIVIWYDSPYYRGADQNEWIIYRKKYCIPEAEWEEFIRWCDSFGDFAVLLQSKDIYKEIDVKTEELPIMPLVKLPSKNSEGKVIKDKELFSTYNSLAAEQDLITYPTKAEWGWLAFVLEKFPKFVQVFLEQSVFDKLKEKVNKIIRGDNIFFKDRCGGESWFDGQIYDIESIDQARKYQRILDDIRNRRCCKSESKMTGIHYSIPYVLDMNYTAFTRKAVDEPFVIMVYDLKEKRSCAVPYREFYTTNRGRNEVQEDLFSLCERYYYLCAYCVRLRWKQDNTTEGNFDYAAEFVNNFNILKQAVKELDEPLRTEMENVITNSFQYMYRYAVKNGQNRSVNEKEREVNGVALFQDVEFLYKSQILKKMTLEKFWTKLIQKNFQDELMDIPEEDIKDFIVGTGRFDSKAGKGGADGKSQIDIFREKFGFTLEKDEVFTQNEAVFSNELKKCIVKFRLKKGFFTEKNLNILYDYFREFHCYGQYKKEDDKKGRVRDEVLFSVEYPRFEFRRVHQILLALTSMIDFDTVWPDETRNVLTQRLEGKEKNRKELVKLLSVAERDGKAYTGEER